jgi:hypothetical protein
LVTNSQSLAASVTTLASTTTAVSGSTVSLAAEYVLNVTAGNRVAGFKVTALGGGASSTYFTIQADKFAIINTAGVEGSKIIPFYVDVDGVFIDTAYIKSLIADKIAAGTINVAVTLNAATINGGVFNNNSGTFKVDADGRLTASAAQITGKITATTGQVGGWNIGTTALTGGSGGTSVGLDVGGSNPAFYAGSATPGSAPFRVTNVGALTSTSGQIGGWTINTTTLKAGNTELNSNGNVTCVYLNATGSGKIGGWDISSGYISGGNIAIAAAGYIRSGMTNYDTGTGWYLGNDGKASFGQGGGANRLLWNGSNLAVHGGIYAQDQIGLRYKDNQGVLTITGGSTNGSGNGAQIDLAGNDLGGASLGGYLVLQAGQGAASTITFLTNRSLTTNVGVVRMSINTNGLVSIEKNISFTSVYTPDAGNMKVFGNLAVGSGQTPQNTNTGEGRIDAGGAIVAGGNISTTAGTITAYGDISTTNGILSSPSSIRFKTNVNDLVGGIETLEKIRPVTFDWKTKNVTNDIGFIAEELVEVLPTLVRRDENGECSGVDYGRMAPIFAAALKESVAELRSLKAEVELLKTKISELERK